jgi:energy-coupling factor transporter ATP-binding protein EcfA2
MKVLEVRDLEYVYPDGSTALSGVDMTVDEKESVALIGPNGAGKTTLFLCICGLLKSKGMIRVFGEELTAKNAARLRRKMSYVFQDPNDQLFMPTVFEDVAFGLSDLGYSRDEIPATVKNSLEAVTLRGFENRSGHHLSLGEKKKVCLAAALARKSTLMFFDEPTSELDPAGRREFMNLIGSIESTRVIASHDLNLVVEMCDRSILIDRGRIIAGGHTRQLLSDSALMESHGLEVPLLLQLKR